MDLVRQAGFDVSEWENYPRGEHWAEANPKFCYEWSFVDLQKNLVVINLWHADMREETGGLTWTSQPMDTAMRVTNALRSPWSVATKVKIAQGLAAIGFTGEQLEMAKGKPIRAVEEETAAGKVEMRYYNDTVVTLSNGRVSKITTIK